MTTDPAVAQLTAVPGLARLDLVNAIRLLIRFGGIDGARNDHPRLATAARRVARDRWQYNIPQDVMVAALPALIAEAEAAELVAEAESLALATAMAGDGELTPAEKAAAARGITPATFRRLHPAVTGDLVDELLPRIQVVRDDLVRRLTDAGHEDVATTIAGDVREAGYRVALTEVRRGAYGETVRRAAFHLELALVAVVNGHRSTAERSLAKAAAVLAV